MPPHPPAQPAPETLRGFYHSDPHDVTAALRALADERCEARLRTITTVHPTHPAAGCESAGFWSEEYFGKLGAPIPDRWAVVEVALPLLHRTLLPTVAALLGITLAELQAVRERRAWLEAGRCRFPNGHPGIEAALATPIEHWPPSPFRGSWPLSPSYATYPQWRREQGVPDDVSFDSWLTEKQRELGVDVDALDPDDGWREDALKATGDEAIVRALSEREDGGVDWLVTKVPVAPLTDRPMLPRPGDVSVLDARTRALVAFAAAAARLRTMVVHNAPDEIMHAEREQTQLALDRVLGGVGQEALSEDRTAPMPRFVDSDPSDRFIASAPDLDGLTQVAGLALTEDGSIALIDFPSATVSVALDSVEVTARWTSSGTRLLTVVGEHLLAEYTYTGGFAIRHLPSRRWLDRIPDSVPFAFLETQGAPLVAAHGRLFRLHELADFPAMLIVSACGSYFATMTRESEGGVYRYDGELHIPLCQPPGPTGHHVLRRDGRFDSPSARERERFEAFEYDTELLAIALSRSRDRWRLFRGQTLFDGEDERFSIARDVQAAAFSADGDTLICAIAPEKRKRELWVIDVDPEPRLRLVIDLSPLVALFVGSRTRRPRVDALHAALYWDGTLADLGSNDRVPLAARNVTSVWDGVESRTLGKARARRLRTFAAEVEVPRRLPAERIAS